ncbi:cyclic beta-1,2-glucan ABC transporter [Sphingomonas oleivorans]|uniref:Cyclic beta-1,2-glucan ABC transporter n=1 Tax=Sphingomonas oleivorans TaxID=1735121 RepID=A0A2T5G191_9SPHN|nr:glucan ABC transporter ATP-binding protein/ permease [Sphingomonas oleivorans]PTQ12902.1 cyclic beta-1,2-glucan ABC transporter [Sphingomonas oleivorans]
MAGKQNAASRARRGSHVFMRAIGMLRPERGTALAVVCAGAMVALLQVAEPILFGKAVNALAQGHNSLGFIALWCALSLTAFLAGMVVALMADRMAHRRRLAAMARFVEHLLALPPSFHTAARSGRMMRIMISGCETLFSLWLPMLREQLINVVSLIALVPVALWMNWRLALVLLALMAVYTVINLGVMRRTSGRQAQVENHFTDISGHVGDLFGNVPVLQSFLAVPGELRSIRGSLQQLLAAQYPVLNWWALVAVLTRGASSISIVAIFAVGAMLVSRGLASLGDIVAFVGFATLLIGRLDQFTSFVMNMFMRRPSLAQFFEILDHESHIVERPDAAPLRVERGHVVFENVSFRYPTGSGAIRDLNFEAKPGETVAIVGPTGSGKSTALGLLQRAFDPQHGRILVDGRDIRDVTLASLRAATGVVFQEAGLFNRTIAENIAMGRPDATAEQIEEAARIAGAYDFIMRKEGGFSSAVGDRGQGLSGGERQRIAIARALLKDAPILLLDEATSALDVATEARLQESLDRLRRGRTTFVIAHRLSTIRSADRIIVLDAGRIVEQGGFDELVEQGGMFARLVRDGGMIPSVANDDAAPLGRSLSRRA